MRFLRPVVEGVQPIPLPSGNRRPRRVGIGNLGLWGLMWVALVVTMGATAVMNPYGKAPVNLFLGAIIVVLALLPLSSWIAQPGERPIPLLAMHGVFYAICFGAAGFIGRDSFITVMTVGESAYRLALIGALVSWLMVSAGYALAHQVRPSGALSVFQIDSPGLDRMAVLLVYPISAAVYRILRDANVESVVQIAAALRIFAFVWILHAAWSGRLSRTYRRVVFSLMVPAELLLFGGLSSGVLVGLLVYGQIIGITFAITRGRLPITAAVLTVVVFGLLTPSKNEFRVLTWNSSTERVGPVEGTVMFLDMAWSRYNTPYGGGATGGEIFDEAYKRVNHLQTVAAVIEDTPRIQDYRYGSTLLPLLTKWIPRAVWSNKPREDLGNSWARDYSYVGTDDFVTAYNLPWLAEMYMNFGWLGIAVMSLGIGALMGALSRWIAETSAGSVQFAFALTMASAFFFPESNLSAVLGGLTVSGASIFGLMFAIRAIRPTRVAGPRRVAA